MCLLTRLYGSWKGFKIVGDNIDKNFRWTFQRIDYQTRSFHFFHSYAVLDRVDLKGVSDLPQPGVIEVKKVLPSEAEVQELKHVFSILVARFVCSDRLENDHDLWTFSSLLK